MFFALSLLAGLATAARYCIEADPPISAYDPNYPSLPGCTTKCLSTDTSVLDGVCADNLRGICELDGGVASFFRVYTTCLSKECGSVMERKHFTITVQYYCGWYPTITPVEAGYFGQWSAYLWNKSTATSQISTASTQPMKSPVTLTSRSTSNAISTSTNIDTISSNSNGPVESVSSTQTSTATSADGSTSFQDDMTSSTGETTAIVRSAAASSLAVAQIEPQPVLSTSAIAGVAVGGILAISLIGGGLFFLLRRRRRYPRALSPPNYEPNKDKLVREKAGLDEPYSGVGVGGPVGFAELDGSAPVSPVVEPPMHLSASQRQARVAQNF